MKSRIREILLLTAAIYCGSITHGKAQNSTCYGQTNNGRLENGVLVRADPARYYCDVCVILGRVYAHAPVADTVTAAYQSLVDRFPETDFVLGEVGWRRGGAFKPHRTHQNGLSVDFMVPLTAGVILPTDGSTRFGYDLEFDSDGKGPAGQIDFDAIDAHLQALEAEARNRGGRIRRIFFAPDLSARLSTETRAKFAFNAREAWVRHDDHYHVDFDFPCAKLQP